MCIQLYYLFRNIHKTWILYELLGWNSYAFLVWWLEKGIVFQFQKLENHIPGDLKRWKTVLEISGNHELIRLPPF